MQVSALWWRKLGLCGALLLSCASYAAFGQASNPTSPAPAAIGNQAGAQSPASESRDHLPASESSGSITPEPIAQEPSSSDQGGMFVFKKEVEEVFLHATVTDQHGNLVPRLDRSAFSVFENGQPQTITSFRREDVPVAIGIVIDNSGSMRDKRAKVNQAVMNLVRASNPHDEVFVVNFNDNPYLDQDFTSDVNLLQVALKQVSTKGSTALYDAVVASAVHLDTAHVDKKVLLVITDGEDNMSRDTLEQASRKLQQANGPVVYAVGLLGGTEARARQDLQELADGTGGAAYFPATLDQVDDLTRTIAHDIRSQYLIAYKPRNQNSKPEFQSIRVEAYAPAYGKLIVRTKSGYYPPSTSH